MRFRILYLLCLTFPVLTGWGHWGPQVKIGLYLHQSQNWKPLIDQLKAEVEENRGELVVKEVSDTSLKIGSEELKQQGVEALVVIPGDTVGNLAYDLSLVKAAHEAGIKVISLDDTIYDTDLDYLVAFNGEKAGELQAKALIKKVPKGRYVLLKESLDGFSKEIQEGQMKILQPLIDRGDIQTEDLHDLQFLAIYQNSKKKPATGVITKADLDSDKKKAGEILGKEIKRADAVLATDAIATEDALHSIEKNGLEGKIQVAGIGQDKEMCRKIAAGAPLVTIYHSPQKLAAEAAYLAAKLARNAKEFDCQFTDLDNNGVTIKAVLLTPVVVDAQNLDSTIIRDGVQKKEEVYGK